MNLLFVCSQNKLRSPTGEAIFSQYDAIEAIGCGTNADAETPLSGDLIQWSDIIFVMEKSHRNKVSKKFKPLLKNKRLICLSIADNYAYMDSTLIKLLENRVLNHIHTTVSRNK